MLMKPCKQNLSKIINNFHRIIPFELTYDDVMGVVDYIYPSGKMSVSFFINEKGDVENPYIIDTFNVKLNDVVIDKKSDRPNTNRGYKTEFR